VRFGWTFLPAALFLLAAAPGATPVVLAAQAWTAHSAQLAHDLTTAPGECLGARTPQIEAGRALFRSPTLIGGPASRLGMSCNSCHVNARGNVRFMLPEMTDRMGAADVTSEWASHVRGDGVMNPVDIPDLADVGARASYGHAHDPSLEHFAHSVIVEEFQGEEPPPAAFASLVAYLRALRSDACVAGDVAISLAGSADDVRRALSAGESADAATASLLLLSAQEAIGRIVERLPARAFARDRSRVEALSRELAAMRRADDPRAAWAHDGRGWSVRFDAAVMRVAPREARTYFNEATLRAALTR
jgi:hypothetical protein